MFFGFFLAGKGKSGKGGTLTDIGNGGLLGLQAVQISKTKKDKGKREEDWVRKTKQRNTAKKAKKN